VRSPAPELTDVLSDVAPGAALDLACGSARHTIWLAERGWHVTAVDQTIEPELAIALLQNSGIHAVQADLETGEFRIEADAWDLIVCWLYWQPELLPAIAQGVRRGGVIALAGKTSGRFATSLAQYRAALANFTELASGENEIRAFFVARR
jgi:SAM-dependent methyltransferase